MPIAKGEPWGELGRLPDDGVIFETDAMASRAVEYARAKGLAYPVIGLTEGDLWRTLGAPAGGAGRLRSGPATQVTVDVGWVRLDDEVLEHAFVAHCILRTRAWANVLAVMNAEWLGEWDVAPRSHPGDGWLDITESTLSWPERRKVRDRLPTGTHLPHPELIVSRVRKAEFVFDRPRRMYVDGAPFPRVRSVKFRLESASLTVLV